MSGLKTDSTVGRFVVEREAGRGAMGVVYLARDTRLGRVVALKALPEHLASDAARLERLEREARMLASLNHPNIASIYSLEEHAGRLYLVLEWAQGQPLDSRLREGALEPAEAAGLCHQVARALAAAHGRGVIHRDLKPANVMLGPEGSVKVLDFGLAKSLALPEEASWPAPSEAGPETLPPPGSGSGTTTQVGAILGTPGYMSPEQVRGEAADARSDLWALACILFESLTGQRLFHGQTLSETFAATLSRDPDYARLPPAVPREVADLLRACLSKDAPRRPADASVAVAVLERWMADLKAGGAGAAAEHPNNLPADLTSFIGRESQLADVGRLLEANRLVTLVGVGGCGKTRLSRRAAREALDRFPGGVWFVELAALSDPDQVPQAIAAVLGVRTESPAEQLAQIARRIGQSRTLLILDNCEHLLESCARVSHQLLEACPELHILASSREGMAVPGEAIYAVPPLSLPPPSPGSEGTMRPEEVLNSDATALFVERARAAGATLELTPATAAGVTRICRKLDGIPLAIELAAARLRAMTTGQLEARLDDAFRLLTGGSRTALPRHRTLRATIDWSYNLLSAQEQRLLRRLTVFRGGWNLEAAEAICADPDEAGAGPAGDGYADPIGSYDVLDLLSALVEKSLVIREPAPEAGGELRYRLLETIRQYAAEAWSALGGEDAQAVRNRHLDYFAGLAEQAWHGVQGREQAKWIRRMRLDLENAIAAVNWCESAPDGLVKELRLCRHLGLCAWTPEPSVVGLELCRRALARDAASQPIRDRGLLLNQYGLLLVNAGDPAAETLMLEAIELLKEVGEKLWLAHSHNDIALAVLNAGRLDEARQWLELCLAETPPDDTRLLTVANTNLARVEMRLGNLDRAEQLLAQGFSLVQPHDLRWRWHLCNSSALLALRRGQVADAAAHLREAVQILAELDTVQNWIWTLPSVIQLAEAHSDWESVARTAGGLQRLHTAHGLAPPLPSSTLVEARRQLGDERYDNLERQGASSDTYELCLQVLERLDAPAT